MAENWNPQPDTHSLESLTLGLVDGGGEDDADGKLSPGPFEREASRFRDELDPWDEYFLVIPGQLAHQQHVVKGPLVDQLRAVAQTLLGTDVPKKYQRHPRLKVDVVSWKAIGTQCVEVLYVEPHHVPVFLQGVCTA